uniref:Uncharacterized protein n=2 Tax=Stomoxys calcitrans TaxID=35570 RepID=A0A1I8QED5_STOCA
MTERRPMRVRTAPVRKWQRTEERALIDYLKSNIRDFEKPTAQVFYRKFIEEYRISDIEWKLVRAKVRNMRISYGKAKQWLETQGSNLLHTGENVQDMLYKMCSFYSDFDELFENPSRADISSYILDNSTSSSDFVKEEMLSDTNEDMLPAETDITRRDYLNEGISNEEEIHTTNSVESQEALRQFKKVKLDMAHLLKEEELKLLKERLEFDKAKFKQEMEIRQREIDSNERLKILELEMKERIAMSELKMKERIVLNALGGKM